MLIFDYRSFISSITRLTLRLQGLYRESWYTCRSWCCSL